MHELVPSSCLSPSPSPARMAKVFITKVITVTCFSQAPGKWSMKPSVFFSPEVITNDHTLCCTLSVVSGIFYTHHTMGVCSASNFRWLFVIIVTDIFIFLLHQLEHYVFIVPYYCLGVHEALDLILRGLWV
jgi:hypothetical protein